MGIPRDRRIFSAGRDMVRPASAAEGNLQQLRGSDKAARRARAAQG